MKNLNKIIEEFRKELVATGADIEGVKRVEYRHLRETQMEQAVQLLIDAYNAGLDAAVEAVKSTKAITPNVEPPPNHLSQNQIFAGGQVNMHLRVMEAIESIKALKK